MHDEPRHDAASRTTGISGGANIGEHEATRQVAKNGTSHDVPRRSKSDAKFWLRRLFKAKSDRGTDQPILVGEDPVSRTTDDILAEHVEQRCRLTPRIGALRRRRHTWHRCCDRRTAREILRDGTLNRVNDRRLDRSREIGLRWRAGNIRRLRPVVCARSPARSPEWPKIQRGSNRSNPPTTAAESMRCRCRF